MSYLDLIYGSCNPREWRNLKHFSIGPLLAGIYNVKVDRHVENYGIDLQMLDSDPSISQWRSMETWLRQNAGHVLLNPPILATGKAASFCSHLAYDSCEAELLDVFMGAADLADSKVQESGMDFWAYLGSDKFPTWTSATIVQGAKYPSRDKIRDILGVEYMEGTGRPSVRLHDCMEGVLQGYVEITADIRNINVKRAQDLSILLSKIIYAIIAINGMYSLMECTIEMFKYVTKEPERDLDQQKSRAACSLAADGVARPGSGDFLQHCTSIAEKLGRYSINGDIITPVLQSLLAQGFDSNTIMECQELLLRTSLSAGDRASKIVGLINDQVHKGAPVDATALLTLMASSTLPVLKRLGTFRKALSQASTLRMELRMQPFERIIDSDNFADTFRENWLGRWLQMVVFNVAFTTEVVVFEMEADPAVREQLVASVPDKVQVAMAEVSMPHADALSAAMREVRHRATLRDGFAGMCVAQPSIAQA